MSSASSTLEANMRSTTEALVYAFNGQWTLEAALAPRAPECQHITLPETIGIPPKNNEEWAARFTPVAPLFKDGKMVINDYISLPSQRRSVCRTTLTAMTPLRAYGNEYVWFLDFDETGEKITKITEFMDRSSAHEIMDDLIGAGLLPKRG